MAAVGIVHDEIAAALGISDETLRKYFGDELATGKTRTLAKVADSLVRQALAGNMTAAIFYLKTQGGWRETSAVELSAPGGGPLQVETIRRVIVDPKHRNPDA